MNAAARRNRRSPGRWRACAAGAAAVAALLTTTACESGTNDTADGPKPSDQPATTSPATTTPPGDGDARNEEGGGTGDQNDSDVVDLCTMKDLSFSATDYHTEGELVRHLLVVATNKSDKKCDVQNAPEITLGDAQGPASVMEGTDPGETVTLAPGEKAYAGVLATGGNRDTYDVTFMTLTLGSPGGESEAEEPIDLPMPVASFPADDGQRVTHWQGTEGLAMRPVTQS